MWLYVIMCAHVSVVCVYDYACLLSCLLQFGKGISCDTVSTIRLVIGAIA